MPTRVVDIGEEELKLLETYNQTGLNWLPQVFGLAL